MTFLNFTFQDPSPLISYSPGQWVEGSPTNDTMAQDYSEDSFKVTFDAGATATLNFVGNSITVYGAQRPNHGNYSVVLDNGPEFVANGNGNNIFQFPLWNAQDLDNSEHNVVITNIPTTSTDVFFDVDFISIGREIGPAGYDGTIFNVTIDDESPFVVYSTPKSWLSSSSNTASNSTLHSTTEEGASVSLSFQGSSVELYGLYVNAPLRVNLDNQFPRNLAGPNVSLQGTIFQHPQTLLYYADGLDENQTHVVTMINSVGDSDRPLYFDFAIVRSSQEFIGDTPSPNAGFAVPTTSTSTLLTSGPTKTPGPTDNSQPVGAIVGGVVGGVAGLLILAFIGFILYRRSRKSAPLSSVEESNVPPMESDDAEIANSITPYVLPPQGSSSSSSRSYMKSLDRSVAVPSGPTQVDSSNPPNSFLPASTASGSVHNFDSKTSQTTDSAPNQPSAVLVPEHASYDTQVHGDQYNQNEIQQQDNTLITQTYILQESDAGRLIQTRLPPMYNPEWDDSQAQIQPL